MTSDDQKLPVCGLAVVPGSAEPPEGFGTKLPDVGPAVFKMPDPSVTLPPLADMVDSEREYRLMPLWEEIEKCRQQERKHPAGSAQRRRWFVKRKALKDRCYKIAQEYVPRNISAQTRSGESPSA